MTDKEKQINEHVIVIRRNLHKIMMEIESEGLFDELVNLDKQIYEIRKIVKSVE